MRRACVREHAFSFISMINCYMQRNFNKINDFFANQYLLTQLRLISQQLNINRKYFSKTLIIIFFKFEV